MLLEHRLSALLQPHLHSRLNTWLQWIEQRQLQGETRNILVLGLCAPDIRGLTVSSEKHLGKLTVLLSNPCLFSHHVHHIGKLYFVVMFPPSEHGAHSGMSKSVDGERKVYMATASRVNIATIGVATIGARGPGPKHFFSFFF